MKEYADIRTDREILVSGTRQLLASMADWMTLVTNFDWDGSNGYLKIIRRSALLRQFDSLQIMAELAESNRGYAAVSLLRPSCEELLWLRYLKSITESDGIELIDYLVSTGIWKDLEAQAGEIGENSMGALGLSQALEVFRAREEPSRNKLKLLGERLGWPQKMTKNGNLPSTWYFAKETNSEDLYRFLYHATSRYVHFSPVELGRRGWGKGGRLRITSSVYEPHWAIFALQWGARLFGFTIEAVLEALTKEGVPEPPHDKLLAVFESIAEVAMIPLITAEELKWEPQK